MPTFFQETRVQETWQAQLKNLIIEGRKLAAMIDSYQLCPQDFDFFTDHCKPGKETDSQTQTQVYWLEKASRDRLRYLRSFILNDLSTFISKISKIYPTVFEVKEEIHRQAVLKICQDFENKILEPNTNLGSLFIFGTTTELAPLKQAFNEYLDFFENPLLSAAPQP